MFVGGGEGLSKTFLYVTKLHYAVIKVLDKCFQAPVLAEINYHGWVAGGGGGRLDQMKLRLTQPSLG